MDKLVQELLLVGGLDDTLSDDRRPIWTPMADSPQERAYNSQADVIGFGGASRGGKSQLALGLAFTKHTRSTIFRATYPNLRGLIDDGDEILRDKTRFIEGKGWRFDGRSIMLRYMERVGDWRKWKGTTSDLMVFDEADEMLQENIESISGWNGTTDPYQKVTRLILFNPPDIQGEWLIEYFGAWVQRDIHPNPAEDGALRYYRRDADGKSHEIPSADVFKVNGYAYKKHLHEQHNESAFFIDGRQYTVTDVNGRWELVESRTFFKALIDDNPYAMATGHNRILEAMDEPLRSQLRWGDFSIGRTDDIMQVIPTQWIIDAQARWSAMEKPDLKLRAVGCDPSRGGKDECVTALIRGVYFDELDCHEGTSIPKREGGQYVANIIRKLIGDDDPQIGIDADGIGASVLDDMVTTHDETTTGINSGSRGFGRDKSGKFPFANLRSKMWWEFREALDPESGIELALPPDRQLRLELRAPIHSKRTGKIQVEKKEDIAKRIQGSTNRADAVIYAWYIANNIEERALARSF